MYFVCQKLRLHDLGNSKVGHPESGTFWGSVIFRNYGQRVPELS